MSVVGSDLVGLVQGGAAPTAVATKEPADEDIDQAMASHKGRPQEVASLLAQSDGKTRSRLQQSIRRVLPKDDLDEIEKLSQGGGGKAPQKMDKADAKDAKAGGKDAGGKAGGKDGGKDAKGGKDGGKAGGKAGGGADAAGGSAGKGGGDPKAEVEATAATFPTDQRQMVVDEIAEHQQWAALQTEVGAAGSADRAVYALERAGAGFGRGLVQGAVTGFIGGLASKALEKVPIVGAILAGALSAYSLITGWSQTVDQLGGLAHNPFASWENAANFMDGLGALLGLIGNILNILAGLAAFAAGLGLVLTIIGIGGFVLPWAVPFATYAMLASTLLGLVNSFLVQPAAAAFRFMHVFTMDADPKTVIAAGDKLRDNAKAFGAGIGSALGTKAGAAVGEHFDVGSAGTWAATKFPPLAGNPMPPPAPAPAAPAATGGVPNQTGSTVPGVGAPAPAGPGAQGGVPNQTGSTLPGVGAPPAATGGVPNQTGTTTPGIGGPTPTPPTPAAAPPAPGAPNYKIGPFGGGQGTAGGLNDWLGVKDGQLGPLAGGTPGGMADQGINKVVDHDDPNAKKLVDTQRHDGKDNQLKKDQVSLGSKGTLDPPPGKPDELTEIIAKAMAVAIERKNLMDHVKVAQKVTADSAQRKPAIQKWREAGKSQKDAAADHAKEADKKQVKLDAAKGKHEEYKEKLAAKQDSLSGGPIGTILGVTRTMESMVSHLNRILDVSGTLANITGFRKNLEKGQQALTGEGGAAAARAKEHADLHAGIQEIKTTSAANQAQFSGHDQKLDKLQQDDEAAAQMAAQAHDQGMSEDQKLAAKQKGLEAQFAAKRATLVGWATQHKAARLSIYAKAGS